MWCSAAFLCRARVDSRQAERGRGQPTGLSTAQHMQPMHVHTVCGMATGLSRQAKQLARPPQNQSTEAACKPTPLPSAHRGVPPPSPPDGQHRHVVVLGNHRKIVFPGGVEQRRVGAMQLGLGNPVTGFKGRSRWPVRVGAIHCGPQRKPVPNLACTERCTCKPGSVWYRSRLPRGTSSSPKEVHGHDQRAVWEVEHAAHELRGRGGEQPALSTFSVLPASSGAACAQAQINGQAWDPCPAPQPTCSYEARGGDSREMPG